MPFDLQSVFPFLLLPLLVIGLQFGLVWLLKRRQSRPDSSAGAFMPPAPPSPPMWPMLVSGMLPMMLFPLLMPFMHNPPPAEALGIRFVDIDRAAAASAITKRLPAAKQREVLLHAMQIMREEEKLLIIQPVAIGTPLAYDPRLDATDRLIQRMRNQSSPAPTNKPR